MLDLKLKLNWIRTSAFIGLFIGNSVTTSYGATAQPKYIEILKPLDRSVSFGFDRTASNFHGDVARGQALQPALNFYHGNEIRLSSGLFAGGKLKIKILSYQMWLLNHPTVTKRSDIPENTSTQSGRFEISFLNSTNVISTVTAVAGHNVGETEEDYCLQCNDTLNPAYVSLETDLVAIPTTANAVRITLVSTVDLTTGQNVTAVNHSATMPIFYHANPEPFHIRGKENSKLKDATLPQFSLMEAFPVNTGASFQFEVEGSRAAREFSMIWFNADVTRKYKDVPVCYDEFNRSRIHYAEGNDIQVLSKLLYYRVDGGPWQLGQKAGDVLNIPPVTGAKLEFVFAYELSLDLNHGLYDINRCYQLGSDFKWVPSHPGVPYVKLGTFYDSPKGDLSEGWSIQLNTLPESTAH